VGPVDGVEHFYQASGFMGHGFMMAPIIGKLLAGLVSEGEGRVPPLARGHGELDGQAILDRWNFRRFAEGKLLSEAMIIG
jgi:sarcosine oxidase subunit beta